MFRFATVTPRLVAPRSVRPRIPSPDSSDGSSPSSDDEQVTDIVKRRLDFSGTAPPFAQVSRAVHLFHSLSDTFTFAG